MLVGCPIIRGKLDCNDNNLLGESELFLYNCTSAQIRQYYNGKDLNNFLVGELSEEVKVKLKVNKI